MPVQSGNMGQANTLGGTAGTNTLPSPTPHTPASATASATTATADSSPGMRGQRRRSPQASTTTARAASRCQPVRASHNASAPAPKPLRTCPTTIDKPTPAANPWVTEMGRNRATDASRNTPNSHWNTKAKATVAPLTASTWRALRPRLGAAPWAVASTAANSNATTVVGAYTTPARGVAKVSSRPGKAADHNASAARECSPASGANASSPSPTAWGTVTAAADHAAAAPEGCGADGPTSAPAEGPARRCSAAVTGAVGGMEVSSKPRSWRA